MSHCAKWVRHLSGRMKLPEYFWTIETAKPQLKKAKNRKATQYLVKKTQTARYYWNHETAQEPHEKSAKTTNPQIRKTPSPSPRPPNKQDRFEPLFIPRKIRCLSLSLSLSQLSRIPAVPLNLFIRQIRKSACPIAQCGVTSSWRNINLTVS